jgi:regulator of chromosome condensation
MSNAYKSKVVQEPSTALTKKRKVESEPAPVLLAPKRQRTEEPLNTAPSQKLNIYIFGSGESGELGLGHVARNGKKPIGVKRPRLNDLLDASKVGIVQMAVGGMHCVALTHDGKVLTWGVNDNSALGRDTTWEAPTRDMDAESDIDEDSDDGESGLNPRESTPTAIPAEFFSKDDGDLVQVAAADSASFVLTSKGFVYGWGTFSVSTFSSLSAFYPLTCTSRARTATSASPEPSTSKLNQLHKPHPRSFPNSKISPPSPLAVTTC